MVLDLNPLHSHVVEEILIDTKVSYPKELLNAIDIVRLDDIAIKGKVYQNASFEDVLFLDVSGVMILKDSISLEEVEYPFSFQIDRILEKTDKNDENTLDIMTILWENIILEIPLKFTKVSDLSKFHGDGWKLISEEEVHTKNNPFSDLLKEFGEE